MIFPLQSQLVRDLIKDEGMTTAPYFDSQGYVTFGIGHNLHAHPLTEEQRKRGSVLGFQTKAFAHYLFEEDLRMTHRYITEMYSWVLDLPMHQQRALYNMMFQLGHAGFGLFEPTWKHLREGNVEEVVRHLKASKWYRQTPERAERVIKLLKGEETK